MISDDKIRLKKLKDLSIITYTEDDWDFLIEKNIINGVGNNCLPKWLRWILTQFCFYLSFDIHDVNYWKLEGLEYKEREIGRKQADFGLLKYGFVAPIRPIEKYSLTGVLIPDTLNLTLTIIKFLLSFLTIPFVLLAYIAVRFGGKNSF